MTEPTSLLLRTNELAATLGVKPGAIFKWLREPDPVTPLPRPLKLGRMNAWRRSDIEDWLERKAQQPTA